MKLTAVQFEKISPYLSRQRGNVSIIFGNEYKIIGLPFFNEEQRLIEFEEAMESFIETL